MTTALDTNILVALLRNTGPLADVARDSLVQAARRGQLLVAAPVYAELLAAPGSESTVVERLLDEASIIVDWQIDELVWRTAALAYRAYAERRRRQPGDPGPRRILADFVIGAHALRRADTFLTFDTRIYQAAFPTLAVRPPGEQ